MAISPLGDMNRGLIYFMFGTFWFYVGVFGVVRSNGAVSGLTKLNRYVGKNTAQGVIRLVTI